MNSKEQYKTAEAYIALIFWLHDCLQLLCLVNESEM